MELNIYQVDTFTDRPFGGNPAGVVFAPKNLGKETMQKIAREMNLSETAFVIPFSRDSFWVRFFTPKAEVDLCGHATIGTFYTLGEIGYIENEGDGLRTVYQETQVGRLAVDILFKGSRVDKVFMEQAKPRDMGKIEDLKELADIMGIGVEDIGFADANIFPEIISTGLADIMLPIRSKERLDRLEVNMEKLSNLSERLNIVGVHAFYLPGRDWDHVYTRNFAPYVGIDEEAATGTSNGALIYYLKKNKLIKGNRIISYQGESMDRPSTIFCEIEERKGQSIIRVGGQARIVISGIMVL